MASVRQGEGEKDKDSAKGQWGSGLKWVEGDVDWAVGRNDVKRR